MKINFSFTSAFYFYLSGFLCHTYNLTTQSLKLIPLHMSILSESSEGCKYAWKCSRVWAESPDCGTLHGPDPAVSQHQRELSKVSDSQSVPSVCLSVWQVDYTLGELWSDCYWVWLWLLCLCVSSPKPICYYWKLIFSSALSWTQKSKSIKCIFWRLSAVD